MKRANNEGSIYYDRRRKAYIAAVTCGYSEKTGTQIRRTKTCRTKTAALAALTELRQTYTGCIAPEGGNTTLIDYARAYIKIHRAPHIRAATLSNYTSQLHTLSALPIASRRLLDLRPSDIQHSLLLVDSVNTRRALHMMLKAIYRQAIADGLCVRNPLDAVTRAAAPLRREIKTITAQEAAILVQAADDAMIAISIQILYSTGCRPEEMLALTWSDIDFCRATVNINKAVSYNTERIAVITAPKTRQSYRSITIPRSLVRDLKAYRRKQQEYIISLGVAYDRTSDLLITYDGKPWHSTQYYYAFRRVAKLANIDITPRGMRHTHATELFSAGLTAKDVQTRLGHSSVKITLDVYTHYIPSRGDDIAAYVESIYPRNSA